MPRIQCPGGLLEDAAPFRRPLPGSGEGSFPPAPAHLTPRFARALDSGPGRAAVSSPDPLRLGLEAGDLHRAKAVTCVSVSQLAGQVVTQH